METSNGLSGFETIIALQLRIHPALTVTKNMELTKKLSQYSWKNENDLPIREFIAEAWSENKSNPNCRPLAKEVGDLIMLKLKKWRER